MFSTSLGAFLPLSDCQEGGTSAVITSPYNPITTMTSFQSKIELAFSDGYNALDTNSPFYHDICTPFTNENGNDVLIDDRRKDYYNETFNLCEEGCELEAVFLQNICFFARVALTLQSKSRVMPTFSIRKVDLCQHFHKEFHIIYFKWNK